MTTAPVLHYVPAETYRDEMTAAEVAEVALSDAEILDRFRAVVDHAHGGAIVIGSNRFRPSTALETLDPDAFHRDLRRWICDEVGESLVEVSV